MFAELIVWGISGSPASFNCPIETYAVARDRAGILTDAMPLTDTNELLGGSELRPLEGVAATSVKRNGLS